MRSHGKNQAAPVQRHITPAEAGGIRFPFEAADLMQTAVALKAHLMRFPQSETVPGPKGPFGKGLPDDGIHMLANPRRMNRGGITGQCRFRESHGVPRFRQSGRPRWVLSFLWGSIVRLGGQFPCRLLGTGLLQQTQATERFS